MTESTFVKPNRIIVYPLEHLQETFERGFIKDLQENQILCSKCSGTGLAIIDNPYGLKDEPNRRAGNFPYKQQTIVGCNNCYSGVINLCEHCQCELPRHTTRCECETAKVLRRKETTRKENDLWDNAIKLKHDDDIAKNMGMYFSDAYPYNEGYFSYMENFTEYWMDEREPCDELKPKYVWGTYEMGLILDTESMLENACDDLHESALDNISGSDVKELQEYLNKWCEEQTGTATYYTDYKYAIEVPW